MPTVRASDGISPASDKSSPPASQGICDRSVGRSLPVAAQATPAATTAHPPTRTWNAEAAPSRSHARWKRLRTTASRPSSISTKANPLASTPPIIHSPAMCSRSMAAAARAPVSTAIHGRGTQRPTQPAPRPGKQSPGEHPAHPGQRQRRQPQREPPEGDVEDLVRVGRVEEEVAWHPVGVPEMDGLAQVIRFVDVPEPATPPAGRRRRTPAALRQSRRSVFSGVTGPSAALGSAVFEVAAFTGVVAGSGGVGIKR